MVAASGTIGLVAAATLPRAVRLVLERRGCGPLDGTLAAAVRVGGPIVLLAIALRWAPSAGSVGAGLLPVLLAVVVGWVVMAAAATDLAARLVPDPISLGGAAAILAIAVALAVVEGSARVVAVAVAVAAGVGLLLSATAALHRALVGGSALGGGDRKLVPVVALGLATLAPSAALLAVIVASWSAGVHALSLLARTGRGGGATLPFAPHLALGTLVALLVRWTGLGGAN
jgi:prepilin signal peptidase PulO-like enzyme (type II secretory pathway)